MEKYLEYLEPYIPLILVVISFLGLLWLSSMVYAAWTKITDSLKDDVYGNKVYKFWKELCAMIKSFWGK